MSSVDARLSVLEQKYIDLLERRVQELERKLAHREDKQFESVLATPDSTKEDTKKESADKPEEDDSKNDSKPKEDETKKDVETESRYRVVIRKFDPMVGDYVEQSDDSAVQGAQEEKESKRAFTFRMKRRMRVTNIDTRQSMGSMVDIESLPLQSLLARAMSKLDAGREKVTNMESPFEDLIWCWKEVNEAAATPIDLEEALKEDFKDVNVEKQTKLDLRALLNIISTSSGDESLDTYFKNKKAMEESRTVMFLSMWTLFPRGSFIIARPFMNQSGAFVVQSCSIPDMDEIEPKLVVAAFNYDWNGTTFNRVLYKFTIDEFKDKKAISELPFYPLSLYREGGKGTSTVNGKSDDGPGDRKDVDEIKAKLIERGKMFFNYCIAKRGKQTFRYDGRAFHTSRGGLFRSSSSLNDSDSDTLSVANYSGSGDVAGSNSYVRGTVVVDFKSYFEYQPDSAQRLGAMDRYTDAEVCSCSECRLRFEPLYRYSWDKATKNRTLTDEQYMMFPPRVLGYALDQKRWVHLEVEKLQSLEEADSKNFDEKLILNQDNKDLIKSIVKAHGKDNVVDYTPRKGKGLIILLWGVPGVGKTLTAESVALLAGKPLFSIGVSDIGTESSKVEINLQRVFALAGLWEAILLFDEADVFLEDRSSEGSDIHRNTMVSVLLRILEYYEGILILTTNRVKTFDIAVQSRIHVAIEYKELGDKEKGEIFMEFLNQLRLKDHIEDWKSCTDWVHEEGRIKLFNGRQIRNTVYTAMGLAHAGGRKLQRKDLIQVARNTEQFKKVLADQEAIYKNRQVNRY